MSFRWKWKYLSGKKNLGTQFVIKKVMTKDIQTQTETEPTFSTPHSLDTLPISPTTSDKACISKCEHEPQCILREPRPPPSPTITFLYNERSKYHQHMMLWSKKEFDGHSRCFAVENENYGCDDCTWLKWWYKWHGENHGFQTFRNGFIRNICDWCYLWQGNWYPAITLCRIDIFMDGTASRG